MNATVQKLCVPASPFRNLYADHYGGQFMGHITVAVLKPVLGALTPQSPSFMACDMPLIAKMYELIARSWSESLQQNGNQEMPLHLVKIHTHSQK